MSAGAVPVATTDTQRRADGAIEPQDRGVLHNVAASLYRKFGTRRMTLMGIAAAILASALTVLVTIFGMAGYLPMSQSEFLELLVVALALMLGGLGAGLWWSRATLRTLLTWSPGQSPEQTATTWHAAQGGLRELVGRCIVLIAGGECAVLPALTVTRLDVEWYVAPVVAVVVITATCATGLLVLFALEILVRPVLEDNIGGLPPDFEPPTSAWKLRSKALAPIPAVTLYAGLTVGAAAGRVHSGSVRLAIAIGVGLVTATVASALILLVTRSVLDPLDALIAATHRVRAGDLDATVPVVTTDELGVLGHSFNRMLAGLRERDALREHNAALVDELQASRARIVASTDAERRRMERDLHDGAQQRIVLMGLKLSMLAQRLEGNPEAGALAAELKTDTNAALGELRDLAHGIYPAILENDGLAGALADAAGRAPLPLKVESDGAGRYPREIEAAVYFCCMEAMQNAAKHAGEGATATVRLTAAGGDLRFEVADDGRGFDATRPSESAGMQNMTDRIGALGGTLRIESAPGRGTTVTGVLPASALRGTAAPAPHAPGAAPPA
jgi:signal transduction histidine kinase